MREAAIPSHRSVPRRRPGRAVPKPKPRARSMRHAMAGLLYLRRHSGKVLAIVGCVVMGGAIVGNAVLGQSGRHPAPLFGHASVPGQAADPVPLPLPRPPAAPLALRESEAPEPEQKIESAAPAPLAKAVISGQNPPSHLQGAKAAPSRGADAITRLLRGGDTSSDHQADADPRVAAAQRALAKLGFPVKVDGRLGNTTREALTKFGHEHHLVPGPDLSPKLLRELSAAARPTSG